MITAHQLAYQLLSGPDLPVIRLDSCQNAERTESYSYWMPLKVKDIVAAHVINSDDELENAFPYDFAVVIEYDNAVDAMVLLNPAYVEREERERAEDLEREKRWKAADAIRRADRNYDSDSAPF